jgi:muramoyltetrapeptide carboxypeptidase
MITSLQKGDTIAIAATARKVTIAEMQPAVEIFESWGLNVLFSDNLFEESNQYAGTDSQRKEGLQKLLDNPQVKAIICARGGYGSVRIIDSLDFSAFNLHPKWLIGFSDVTVLHAHIHTNFDIPTIHGCMPITMQPEKADAESIDRLYQILFNGIANPIEFTNTMIGIKGKSKGKLVGGNLSILYSLLGSNSDIDTAGKILFIEDLDEYLYHVDRMMMNMKRNGKLSNIAGLIVGSMSDMKDNQVPFGKTAEEIILSYTQDYTYPVCFGFPGGHGPKNLPLIFGLDYELAVNNQTTILSLIA